MAFKKINKQAEAISIGQGKDKQKMAEGYLIGARYEIGKDKKKNKKGSNLYQFQAANGDRFDLWGNASIDSALCNDGRIDPNLVGIFIRVSFVKLGKKQPGKNQQQICDVMADDSRHIPAPSPKKKLAMVPKNK